MTDRAWQTTFSNTRNKRKKILANSKEKISIFIYLMTREMDYGYNIAHQFQDALTNKIWDDTKCASIKHESKITSILKNMHDDGLLLTLDEKKRLYPFLSYPKVPVTQPSRIYYCANPDVLLFSYKIELTEKERGDMIRYLQNRESPDLKPYEGRPKSIMEDLPGMEAMRPKLLRDPMSDLELLLQFTLNEGKLDRDEISRRIDRGWHYLKCFSTLRLLETYSITPKRIIKYLNNIPELDYLTILVSVQSFAEEISRIYNENILEVEHIRNSKKYNLPVQKTDQNKISEVARGNPFFNSFKRLEEMCEKTRKEFDPYPDGPTPIKPEDTVPITMLMEKNIVNEVKRARRLHGEN